MHEPSLGAHTAKQHLPSVLPAGWPSEIVGVESRTRPFTEDVAVLVRDALGQGLHVGGNLGWVQGLVLLAGIAQHDRNLNGAVSYLTHRMC